jgi:hypothetical protein
MFQHVEVGPVGTAGQLTPPMQLSSWWGDRQVARIVAEEPVFGKPSAPHTRVTEAVPIKGSRDARVYRQPVKHRQVGLPDGAQMDRRHRAMMADDLPARCRGLPKHARAGRDMLNSAVSDVSQRCGPRRSPHSVAVEEVRPKVGLPPVTAALRAARQSTDHAA